MNKISNANASTIFAALKLIEQLYHDGAIPGFILRNALKEYGGLVDITTFDCFSEDKPDRKE